MKKRFKISKQQNQDSINLKLAGDFDDMSICDLIDVLKGNCMNANNVFINTSSLQNVSISGFGREIFKRSMNKLSRDAVKIQFTTREDSQTSPMENFLFM